MKKIRNIIVLFLIMFFITNSISYAESDIVVRSDNIFTASVLLGIDSSNGEAICSGTVDAYSGTTSISGGLLLYKNYKEYNQTLLKTWHVGTLTNHLSASFPYNLPSRGTYTVVLNVTVFRKGKSESLNIHKTRTY